MNKEPLVLYLLRIVLAFGLFTFMLMLYWSSQLIEKDIKSLKLEVQQMHRESENTRLEMNRLREDTVNIILDDQKNDQQLLKGILHNAARIQNLRYQEPSTPFDTSFTPSLQAPTSPSSEDRPFMDASYPNLLQEDPFYSQTLVTLVGDNFSGGGKRKGAMVGRPPDLHPFKNESSVQSLVGLCSASLSKMHFGKYETMGPFLAKKIEQRTNPDTQELEFWVHLRNDIFWEPLNPQHFPDDFYLHPSFLKRHPVTSEDFKFYVQAIKNTAVESAAPYRNYWGDIKEIEVIDPTTFVVKWHSENNQVKYLAKQLTGSLKPLASFVYKYFADGEKIVFDDSDPLTYQQHSVWAQNFEKHWAKGTLVSCGPWILEAINDDRALFTKNKHFYDPYAALSQSMEIRFKATPDSIWQDYKSGDLDSHSLQPDQLVELDTFLESQTYETQLKNEGMRIKEVDYLRRAYNYVGWNQNTPFFADKEVRQAMSMAIDSQRIIQQNLNGMGVAISGPFFLNSPSNNSNIKPYDYDIEKAKFLLEKMGWYDHDGDGIRDKEVNGVRIPFRFFLSYYVKNPVTKINCDYIATALKEVGIDCQLRGLDITDLSNSFAEKSFDAIYFGWALGTPPETPRQLWHSAGAKENGSSNAIGFQNDEADRIIDQLDYEFDLKKRNSLYHRFHEIIHEEAPYTFLYTPKTRLVYRNYLQNVFIPSQRQDLIPGANVAEPQSEIFFVKGSP